MHSRIPYRIAIVSTLLSITGCTTTKTVTIKTVPESATVFINNSEAGVSSVTRKLKFKPRSQEFDVRARQSGYQEGAIKIGYEPAKQKEYIIALRRLQKTIRIESEPTGANVFLDGQQAGITPLTKDQVFNEANQRFAVTVRKEGFEDGATNVVYAPASQTDYLVKLKKIDSIEMERVTVEPQHTDTGAKLVLTSKRTLAYLEVIERSPNVASVTKVTGNEDRAVNIGAPVLSPTENNVVFTEIVKEGSNSWYSTIQKQRVGNSAKTPLTFGKWQDMFPAFTPDGTNVVFSSNRTSRNATLWQISSEEAGGNLKLTYTQAEDYSPSVAPGNKMIVFASNPPNAEEPQIWSLSRDSNLLTQLREGQSPQVSPDGKRILFVRLDKISKVRQLWVMSIAGGGETQLTQNTDYDIMDPRWSPDGKWIVYASNEGFDSKKLRNYDIWIMTAAGSNRTQLTTNGSDDISPCWDYEGKTVYFLSNRGGAWNIWRFRPILPSE